jgi:hypothetical protein
MLLRAHRATQPRSGATLRSHQMRLAGQKLRGARNVHEIRTSATCNIITHQRRNAFSDTAFA